MEKVIGACGKTRTADGNFSNQGRAGMCLVSVQPMRNVLLNRFLTRAKQGRQPAVLLKPALSGKG